jgi:hypothetical protein
MPGISVLLLLKYSLISTFSKREIYHCRHIISGYHTANCRGLTCLLLERKLNKRVLFCVSMYRVYSVNIEHICKEMREMQFAIPCKVDGLRLTICGCYSWNMVTNVDLDRPFINMLELERNTGENIGS